MSGVAARISAAHADTADLAPAGEENQLAQAGIPSRSDKALHDRQRTRRRKIRHEGNESGLAASTAIAPSTKRKKEKLRDFISKPIDYPDIVPDRARKRCGRIITSGALLARRLVPSDSNRVQCDGHKNLYRPHSILP